MSMNIMSASSINLARQLSSHMELSDRWGKLGSMTTDCESKLIYLVSEL